MKKVLLFLMALFVGFGFMSAGESVAYTLKFGSSYNSQSISSYTDTWSATVDGFEWTIENFNNNSNGWSYVKCGSKSNASVAKITTSSAIKESISKVVITIDAITVSKVNSIQLKTSSTNDFTTSIETVSCTPAQGAITFAITQPQANLFYQLVFDCQKGSSNGLIQLSKVEYYTNETVVSRAATHVSFSPNGGELAESKNVIMTALDAEENAVAGTTIYYKVGNGAEQNGKSPLTITLAAPATVEAWVDGQETHNSATFTFPVVQPSAPVFTVDDEVLSGDDVELPYGTEITISAENATSLVVDVNDEVTTVEANSTTVTVTEDAIISVIAKNGELSTDEAMIMVTVATPELTVKVGETVAEDNGEYTIEQGTAIKVTATNAQSITILDKDGEEVTLEKNCFYPMEDNEYIIEASAGEKSVLISIKVTVTAAEYINMTATYDFTTAGAYGLTTTNDSKEYETTVKDINVNDVNLHFNIGNYRLWSANSGYELRVYAGVSFTISVPSNCYITKITTGVSLTATIASDEPKTANSFTYEASSNVKAVTFTTTGSPKIKTITVSYTKDNYSAEGSITLAANYEYEKGKANVLTFNKPTIKFNGSPIEDGYGEYTVLLNGVELGQADQPISYFAPVNGADNKFQLRKGTKVIDVDVTWPAINAKPAIKGVRYVQNEETIDAIYNIAPEDETPSFSWLINVSNEGAELGWIENVATCTFKNVGEEAADAPAEIEAALVIPFAVKKSADGIVPLAEGDEEYEVVEYTATSAALSTTEFAKNESNTEVSGVADVAVDQNAAAEYYNLQGVRVNGDLTPGLYIRRQGNQATKVVVR